MQTTSSRSFTNSLYALWPHISKRRRGQLLLLALLMVAVAIAEVVSIGAVLPFLGALINPERLFNLPQGKQIINWLGFSSPDQLLLPISGIFAFAAVFSGLAKIVLLKAQLKISYGIGIDLSLNIYKKTLYQNYVIHTKRNSSEIISAVYEKASLVTSGVLIPLLTTASSVIILLSIVSVLLFLAPEVTLFTFCGFGTVYAVIVVMTKKRLFKDGIQVNRRKNEVFQILQESFGGIRDILVDGTQEAFCRVYQEAIIPLRNAESSVGVFSATPRYVIESISMVFMAAISFYFVTRPEHPLQAIPLLGAIALAAQRILPLLNTCYSNWTYVHATRAMLADALNLLDQPLPGWINSANPPPLPFEHALVIRDLSFSYDSSLPLVLNNVNLSIVRGSRVGIIGTTGSGKSTLIDVIMGLLSPTRGSLEVDGVPITDENNRAWQRRLAHVPQTIFLADATILENIAFGVPRDQIDIERAEMAAQMAQIADTIAGLPKGYDSRVGERGVRLSGGQRQRLGIARALYKKADVLILDEATSALDSETEAAVMWALERLPMDLTIIIVAHRVTTLKNCTEIIELDQGRVKTRGGYAELIGYSFNVNS